MIYGKNSEKKPPKKKRPNKYDEKLAIKGTFADVFKVVKKNKEEKKKNHSLNEAYYSYCCIYFRNYLHLCFFNAYQGL